MSRAPTDRARSHGGGFLALRLDNVGLNPGAELLSPVFTTLGPADDRLHVSGAQHAYWVIDAKIALGGIGVTSVQCQWAKEDQLTWHTFHEIFIVAGIGLTWRSPTTNISNIWGLPQAVMRFRLLNATANTYKYDGFISVHGSGSCDFI